jgi:WD40 repeat protein
MAEMKPGQKEIPLAEAREREEAEAWAKVAASRHVADFKAFLKMWPNGTHSADAKARIEELRRKRFRRRAVWIGIVAGASLLAYETFVPDEWIWRQFHDQPIRTFTGDTSFVVSVAFSPDGRTLAAGTSTRIPPQKLTPGKITLGKSIIKLWDVTSGQELRTLAGHTTGWVKTVAFSPDGRTLASASGDNTIWLWEVASGRELRILTAHTGQVLSVAFSPDGATLASGSSDHTIKLWELPGGTQSRTLTGHTDFVLSVAFSPDGRTLASGGWSVWSPYWGWDYAAIKLWDVASGRELRTLHENDVYSVAFSPDGRTLASSSQSDTIRLWDVSFYTSAR